MSEELIGLTTGEANQNVGITEQGLKMEAENISNKLQSSLLKKVLLTSEKIKKVKENDIKFSGPILRQSGNAIIFPHTINVIQGQAGVHKSRLAEYICSALLKRINCTNELLNFKRENYDANYTVVCMYSNQSELS